MSVHNNITSYIYHIYIIIFFNKFRELLLLLTCRHKGMGTYISSMMSRTSYLQSPPLHKQTFLTISREFMCCEMRECVWYSSLPEYIQLLIEQLYSYLLECCHISWVQINYYLIFAIECMCKINKYDFVPTREFDDNCRYDMIYALYDDIFKYSNLRVLPGFLGFLDFLTHLLVAISSSS